MYVAIITTIVERRTNERYGTGKFLYPDCLITTVIVTMLNCNVIFADLVAESLGAARDHLDTTRALLVAMLVGDLFSSLVSVTTSPRLFYGKLIFEDADRPIGRQAGRRQ